MEALDQDPIILLPAHLRAGVAMAPVGWALVAVRPVGSLVGRDDNDLKPGPDIHTVDLRKPRRLELLDFLCDLLDRPIRDLLPRDSAVPLDSEQDQTPAMVQHR